jgi:putative peptide zinc metalloprotease protein
MVYRTIVCVGIILFVANMLLIVGVIMALAALVMWVTVPCVKYANYLATSPELARVRTEAVLSTLVVLCLVGVGIGFVPVPDRSYADGVVEPVKLALVYAASDGFVESYVASGTAVEPDGAPLVVAGNEELSSLRKGLAAERRGVSIRQRLAEAEDVAQAQILGEKVAAIDDQIKRIDEEIESLVLRAPIAGTWLAPEIDRIQGAYVNRGDQLGMVAGLDRMIIRAVAPQQVAARLVDQAMKRVEIRVKGRPDIVFTGSIIQIVPAGQEHLPSAALGYACGGQVAVDPEDHHGTKAAERFFEIRIVPNDNNAVPLFSGQRVVVRFEMAQKPLMDQCWRKILQLFQRRFYI